MLGSGLETLLHWMHHMNHATSMIAAPVPDEARAFPRDPIAAVTHADPYPAYRQLRER